MPAKAGYVEMLREFAAAAGLDEPENLPHGLGAPHEAVASGVEETLLPHWKPPTIVSLALPKAGSDPNGRPAAGR